ELDARPGPALPLDAFAEERMVQEILDQWQAAAPPRRRPKLVPWAVAAAVLLFAGAPAAWAMRGVVADVVTRLTIGARRAQDPAPASPADLGLRASHGVSVPDAASRPADSPPPADTSPPAAAPPPELAAETPEFGTRGVAEGPEEPAPETSPSSSEPPSKPSRSARAGRVRPRGGAPLPVRPRPNRSGEVEALLVRASRLRAAQDWEGAVRLYAQVRRGGAPAAAHVAAVSEGEIRLQQLGDARGARRAFRAARRVLPSGPLVPESWVGEGSAAQALGELEAARSAWRRVVLGYRGTAAADRATALLRDAR
ncbi:MAG: hypothetical protein AAFZ18_23965, partial [Myxococcota bacterium]